MTDTIRVLKKDSHGIFVALQLAVDSNRSQVSPAQIELVRV